MIFCKKTKNNETEMAFVLYLVLHSWIWFMYQKMQNSAYLIHCDKKIILVYNVSQ